MIKVKKIPVKNSSLYDFPYFADLLKPDQNVQRNANQN